MSQENVEIVRRGLEAWNAGDMDAVREVYDLNVIVRALEGWPEPGPFVGRDAVMRQFEQLREAWDADALEPISDFIDGGERVVVRVIWRGAGTGPEANLELTVVYTVRERRVFYQEYFWDHAEALEAAGMREQATSPDEDFRVFRDLCDAFNGLHKGHLDDPFVARPFRYLHEDVEIQDYPAIPGATWHVGHRGALQWTTNLWDSFGDFRLEPREFVPAGPGRFVCVTDTVGQGRSSGLELSMTAYAIVTVEGGKVKRIGITADRQAALEAAGLAE